MVPVLEAGNELRIGRFGWKSQHASLESFSADAYLNEMGITTPLFPDENTSSGHFVGFGDKVIHPYSDFLLHDVGTGDGIPVSPAPEHAATTNMMRTAPLWGLRTRNRLMHDGLSFTKQEAIQRHEGQAAPVRDSYNALTDEQKGQVIEFLNSL
jgi:CxxC motif-containing protein (DUF1111 family)